MSIVLLLFLSNEIYALRPMFFFIIHLQMISGLKTKRRILLTGTPVQVTLATYFLLHIFRW